jgi:hypothetical protein
MSFSMEPRTAGVLEGVVGFIVVETVLLLWARRSRQPAIPYTCAAYLAMLHAVWIAGMLTSQYFETGFGTLQLLTFPASALVAFTMQLPGFMSDSNVLWNYARFVLGFGAVNCLLLSLFVWALKLKPRVL